MTSVQILVTSLAILILIKALVDFRRDKIKLPLFLFWLTLWLVMLVVAVFPQVIKFLEKTLLGVGRGIDAVVYFSIILIFFILFRIIARLEKIKQEITEIVRHLTINKDKEK